MRESKYFSKESGHTHIDFVYANEILDAPTIDAVEAVRCKDCKHWNRVTAWCDIHSHFIDREGQFCYPEESSDWLMFDENYFCKDGERREAPI